jgi:hypothetical protein
VQRRIGLLKPPKQRKLSYSTKQIFDLSALNQRKEGQGNT